MQTNPRGSRRGLERILAECGVIFWDEGEPLAVSSGESGASLFPGSCGKASEIRPIIQKKLPDDIGLLLGGQIWLQ